VETSTHCLVLAHDYWSFQKLNAASILFPPKLPGMRKVVFYSGRRTLPKVTRPLPAQTRASAFGYIIVLTVSRPDVIVNETSLFYCWREIQ
jgi:hypothetical protein